MLVVRRWGLVFLCAFLSLSAVGPASAQSAFAPGERFVEDVVIDGLPIPTAVAFAPDSRIFIALKEGIVRVAQNGVLATRPFLDISGVVNKVTDRGLLGIAVDPQFPQKPYVYLSYVYDPPGLAPDGKDGRVIRVSRFVADAQENYNVALDGSEEVILGKKSTAENIALIPAGEVPTNPEKCSCMSGLTMDGAPIDDCIPCDGSSHTAGSLLFGSDGALFASFGDASDYDRPSQCAFRAQSLDAMSGRVVRVDPDTGAGLAGNPFFDPAKPSSNRSRLWSYGYRNPFRITVNPSNGQVYAGDVGTSYYEEINAGKGGDFGWPCYEGGFMERSQEEGMATVSEKQVGFKKDPYTIDFCNGMYARGSSKVKMPLFTYRHPYDANGKDLGSSVTGVAFYTGDAYPSKYKNALFFADYARHFIRYLTFDSLGIPTRHDFALETGSNLGAVQLLIGPDTNLYAVYLDLKTRSGQVRRFRAIEGANNPPVIKATASPLVGAAPLIVTFSSVGTSDADNQSLSYSWSFGDGTSSSEPNPIHIYSKVGTYTASLRVQESTAPFAAVSKSFTIRVGVTPPVAFIETPNSSYRYEIGKPVTFSGYSVPASGVSLTWSILLKHNQHEHLVTEISGSSGSFMPEEHCDNCSYELCLLASGGEGLIDQRCEVVVPRVTPYTFASSPRGASITYLDESREVLAPYVAYPIVGSAQSIRASEVSDGRTFVRWSDGVLNPTRTFITGTAPRALTAIYENQPPRVIVRAERKARGASRQVRFSAAASRDPEGEPLRFTWAFSDGKTVRGASIKRTFRRTGPYTVRLVVRDRLGSATTYTASLSISKRVTLRRRSVKSAPMAYRDTP